MNKFFISTFAYLRKQLQSFLNDEFKDYNLTSSEIFFMQILNDKDALSQIEVSKLLECDKSHIHRVVTKLIDKNYIKYVDDDKEHIRNIKLTLTKQGKTLAIKIDRAMNKWDKFIKNGLQEEDIKIARKVALKIMENANNFKNMG